MTHRNHCFGRVLLFTAAIAAVRMLEAAAQEPVAWQEAYERTVQLIEADRATDAKRSAEAAARDRAAGEADTLALALFYEDLGVDFALGPSDSVWALGEPYLQESLRLRRVVLGEQHRLVAESLNLLSTYYYNLGRVDESVAWEEESLAILQTLPDVSDSTVAVGRNELALVYLRLGRYSQAQQHFLAALEVFEREDSAAEDLAVDICNSLAECTRLMGDEQTAAGYFERADQMVRELLRQPIDRDRRDALERLRALIDLNRAGLLYDAARYDEAEILYRRATETWTELGVIDDMNLPTALRNNAAICRIQGRYREAEELLEKAVAISDRDLGTAHPLSFWPRSDLGLLYREMGRFDDAERSYTGAIDLLEAAGSAGATNLGTPVRGLADVYLDQGRWLEAAALYERSAISFAEVRGVESIDAIRARIGQARALFFAGAEHWEVAHQLLEASRPKLASNPLYPEDLIELESLSAELRHARGEVEAARDELASVLASAEIVRRTSTVDDRGRAHFFADFARSYRLLAQWCVELDDVDGAIDAMEEFRARVLLDQMQVARVDLRAGVPAEILDELDDRERNAQLELAAVAEQMLGDSDVAPMQLRQRRDAAATELRLVRADLRRSSPIWQKLFLEDNLMVDRAGIQAEVLDADEWMLLFQIGEDGSLVVAIPPASGSPRAFSLRLDQAQASIFEVEPGPLDRQKLARILRSREADVQGARGRILVSNAAAHRSSPALLEWMQRPGSGVDEGPLNELAVLREILVPAELADLLRPARKLIIVPDGLLHRLPFEALVLDRDSAGVPIYWLDRGPVLRYAPSATVLWQQRKSAEGRDADRKTVLSVSDARFGGERPAVEVRGGALPPLPGTTIESDRVVQAFGPSATRLLQREDATELRVREAVGQASILHFATHGIVERWGDDLFAALALTPGDRATFGTRDDGFLELDEIYELDVHADLVVLSACSTHRGDWVDGDGVFALTRGFLASGARRVVGSLWLVDDRSTAELVGQFFQGLSSKVPEMSVGSSLREAKLAIRRSTEWSHPYYWAPFVQIGAR